MKKPMNQFLDALRGLEKARTPLEDDSQVSTKDTASESPIDLNKMSAKEMAEWWLGEQISEDSKSISENSKGTEYNSSSMSEMVSLEVLDKYRVEFEIKPAEELNAMGKHHRRNSIFNDVRQTVKQIQSDDYAFRDGDTFETSKHRITLKIVSI